MLGLKRCVGLLFVLTACRTSPAAPPPEAPPPPPDVVEPSVMTILDGAWSGTADVSPYGPWPYTMVFRRSAAAIVGETPPPTGGTTALGGYQRLVFRRSDGRAVCDYKASVKGGFSEGRLLRDEETSSDARAVYCAEEGCDVMMLSLEKVDDDGLRLVTNLGGAVHTDMTLKAAASSPSAP